MAKSLSQDLRSRLIFVVGETVQAELGFELKSDAVRVLRVFATPSSNWERTPRQRSQICRG